MLQNCIQEAFIERLPIYLTQLIKYDTRHVSSTRLARDLSLGHVQVRKDLAKVSDGGKPKVGYLVKDLIKDIQHYMGFDQRTDVVLIGMGKLGQALYSYQGFKTYNIEIIESFDVTDTCQHIDQFERWCQTHHVDVGIITVPKEHAQMICDLLVSQGIKSIWNFAPIRLNVPDTVVVQNENLANSLSVLVKQNRDGRRSHGLR